MRIKVIRHVVNVSEKELEDDYKLDLVESVNKSYLISGKLG